MKRHLVSTAAACAAAALILTSCQASPDDDASSSGASDAQSSSASSSSGGSQQATPSPSKTKPPQLIGGGTKVFPDRRFVALYGSPVISSLGALGEQDPTKSADRVKKLAEKYKDHTEKEVVPSFEVIATVASSEAQSDGSYSEVTSPKELEPLLDVAEKEDIYVVLDLQPGHSDFLSQAKLYKDLLKRPNVGLALDPEWRLAPGQQHMQQIGSVSAKEINQTSSWLAQLTEDNNLPQKLLVLHQFRHSMIQNREEVNTDHSELATVLHADGHGVPGEKKGTWNALKKDLPGNMRMAWKNFFTQDEPMFTPKQTYDMKPKPWFVSYQ